MLATEKKVMRRCVACGNVLRPGQKFYCSSNCNCRVHYRRHRGLPIADREVQSEHCRCCGDPIAPPHICYCSTTCSARARARLRVGRPVSDAEYDRGEPRVCPECYQAFTRYAPWQQIFCSNRCQDIQSERRRQNKRKQARAA